MDALIFSKQKAIRVLKELYPGDEVVVRNVGGDWRASLTGSHLLSLGNMTRRGALVKLARKARKEYKTVVRENNPIRIKL